MFFVIAIQRAWRVNVSTGSNSDWRIKEYYSRTGLIRQIEFAQRFESLDALRPELRNLSALFCDSTVRFVVQQCSTVEKIVIRDTIDEND